jgi:hypothetical protein
MIEFEPGWMREQLKLAKNGIARRRKFESGWYDKEIRRLKKKVRELKNEIEKLQKAAEE